MSIRYPPRPAVVVGAAVCPTNFLLEVSEVKRPQNFGEDTPDGWTYSQRKWMQMAEALEGVDAGMHLPDLPL